MARLPNRSGGGARTNFNGLNFERETSLNQALRNEGLQWPKKQMKIG